VEAVLFRLERPDGGHFPDGAILLRSQIQPAAPVDLIHLVMEKTGFFLKMRFRSGRFIHAADEGRPDNMQIHICFQ
jgi:hypothetical protein